MRASARSQVPRGQAPDRVPVAGGRAEAVEVAKIDRVANLVVTIAPVGLLGLAMWLAWGAC
jgi:hypothetical protein